MIRWTLLSLAAERARLLGTALGVALAFTLVVFFEAVFEGESQKIVAYPIHAAADVFLPEVLAANDAAMGRSLFGPVMGAVTAVAYVVSLLVIGLVLHVGASARRGSLGVLKALGFRSAQLAAALAAEGIGLFALSLPLALSLIHI